LLAQAREENQNLKGGMLAKLKKLKEKNLDFHRKMKTLKRDKTSVKIEDLKNSETSLIHPFLNPDCAFYQNKTDSLMIELTKDKAQCRPFPVSDDLDLIELSNNFEIN